MGKTGFTGTRSISVCVCTCYNAEQRSLKSPLAQPVILLEGLLCCPRLSDRGKNSFRSAVQEIYTHKKKKIKYKPLALFHRDRQAPFRLSLC